MTGNESMLQDQKNMLFSSTVITSGNAIGVVAYTGMKTAIGSVHKEVSAAKEDEADTPLKVKLDEFSELLAKVIAVICLLVWAMNFTKFFDPIHGSVVKGCIYYFKIAVALAVAAIPEGLPAVITTCLALGTRKMAQNNCIVRRLPSVETLGCTSTICSDKTGTLTKNEMCAVKFACVGNSFRDLAPFDVDEKSYSPECNVKYMTQKNFDENQNYKHLAAVCGLNNRSKILFEDNQFKIQGEPTEAALKVLAEKLGKFAQSGSIDYKKTPTGYSESLEKSIKRVATLDFSSQRKTMSTVVSGYPTASGNTVLLKGAPERVLDRCDGVTLMDGKSYKFRANSEKQEMVNEINKVAAQGYRVLGIGMALDGGNMKHINQNNIKDELTDSEKYPKLEGGCSFIGYVCIKDPVRPEVKDSILACRTAGINVIMITGDAKETAVAIANELNIL